MIKIHRRGFTLVELLVTLAVVSALAVIVLPSVKTMLADRRGSQAAIMVKNYLEAARSRAIASGKPVAVVLERLSSRPYDADENGRIEGAEVGVSGTASPVTSDDDPFINYIPYNSSIRLSMAESPMPITSESLGVPPNIVTAVSGTPPVETREATIKQLTPLLSMYRVGVYLQTRDLSNNEQDLPTRSLIVSNLIAGNEISFGLSQSKFAIAGAQPTIEKGLAMLELYILSGNIAINPTEIGINNLTPPTSAESFIIYPKPKPIAVQNVTLPRGICVDLSVSGFSEPRKLYNFAFNTVSEDPLAAARDYRLRFSSAWVSPISMAPTPTALAPIPQPSELRPIYIVFNPDGSFGRVYANNLRVPGSLPSPALKMIDAAEDLYLHIGRIDQVALIPKVTNPTTGKQIIFPASLDDPSNYIVRVSPKSGAVAASPIGAIRPEDFAPGGLLGDSPSLGDCVSLSRKRAFAQFATGQ